MATHSAEIMNEASSGDVVLIRSDFQTGKRLTTEEGYRTAHELLGSSENADFARLSRAKRIIAFEGNDRSIFRRLEQLVTPGGVLGDPDTVLLRVGGYQQWPKVGNLPWALKELFGVEPRIAAIFDRDYRCIAEIEEHEDTLAASGVFCRVLRRKEIENYFIVEGAIVSAALKAGTKKGKVVDSAQIKEIISQVAASMRDECLINVQSATTKYYQLKKDGRDVSTLLKIAKSEFDEDWNSGRYFMRLCGKEFISSFNAMIQNEHQISISLFQIADDLKIDDIDIDIVNVIKGINNYFLDKA